METTHTEYSFAQSSEERNQGMLIHLSAFSGLLLPIPLANLLVPVLLWQMWKDKSAFLDEQGKKAVNFQLTMTIAFAVSAIFTIILIGLVMMPAVWLASVVCTILAAVKTSNGENYEYPFSIKFF